MIEIRRLRADEADRFHALRLRGLEESPAAFASTLEEDLALSSDSVRARFPSAEDRFVLGAFDEAGALVGAVGFSRETKRKLRHWGKGWGMYVAPEARGRGVGRALVVRLLEECRRVEGLEQVVLEVATEAVAARALYRACGFEPFALQCDAMRDGERSYDVEHLVRRLRDTA
jgi:RimJ/RimL family protein N-acetyltransferase